MSALMFIGIFYLVSSIDPEDSTRNFTEICISRGYISENHKIRTRDDYILTFQRIPPKELNSPIVLLVPGFLTLSDVWLLNDPAIGFLLADAGFDVWFGNVRGLYYSREHAYLDPDADPEYWDFTWNQMADFDVPDSINYILSLTNQPTLTYIGHSQGNIIMTAYLADHPEFIHKLDLYIAFAPIVISDKASNPLFADLNSDTNPFEFFYQNGIFEFGAFDPNNTEITCDDPDDCKLQDNFNSLFVEADNQDLIKIYYPHSSGGTSTRNAEYWLFQIPNYNEKKVQRYDYGQAENLRVYHKVTPPIFNLTQIPAPVALFYGGTDYAVPLDNLQWLIDNLSDGTVTEKYFYESFGHSTWYLADDMSYFTEDVIPLIFKYSKAAKNSGTNQFLQLI